MVKYINKLLSIIMFICTGVLCYRDLISWKYDRLFSYISIVIVVLIPMVLKKTKFRLEEKDKLILNIFIFLADFLGCIVNLYNKIWWFDIFTHYLSGAFTFLCAIFVLKRMGRYDDKNMWFNILFGMGIVFLCAGVWEMLEFSSDCIFNINLQHNLDTGVCDTMEDIIAAFAGSIIFVIVYIINFRRKINSYE